jgi:hypothetical protein
MSSKSLSHRIIYFPSKRLTIEYFNTELHLHQRQRVRLKQVDLHKCIYLFYVLTLLQNKCISVVLATCWLKRAKVHYAKLRSAKVHSAKVYSTQIHSARIQCKTRKAVRFDLAKSG